MTIKISLTKNIIYTCILGSTILLQSMPTTYANQEGGEQFYLDQVVVTANRISTKVSETAANVEIISREQLEKGNYRNLGEVLQHLPGIHVRSYGTPGSNSAAFINGSEQIIVMIDGRRMNLPNGIGGFGMSTAKLSSFVGIENIERIEIVKGGKSALYGADAVGGIINIITKQGEKNETTLKVAGGNWDSSSISLTNEGRHGDSGWYFSTDIRNIGNYSDGNSKTVNHTGSDQDAYTLRLDQKINDGDLTFSYEYFRDESQGNAIAQKFDKTQQNNWDLAYKNRNDDDNGYQARYYQNTNNRRYDGAGHDVTVSGFNYQTDNKVTDKHLFTAGLDWRQDKIKSTEYGNKQTDLTGLYVQDKWDLNNKVGVVLGVRYDNHDVYGNQTTPQASLNYKVSDKTSYYVSWGEVFNAPRFDDLYWPHSVETWGSTTYTYDGNPNLKPETGWSSDFGIKHKFDSTTSGKFTYFYRKLDDAIAWKDISTVPNNQHWVPSNVDKRKAEGIELQLSKNFNQALQGYVGFSYLNIQNKSGDSDYKKDAKVPDKTWNVGVLYSQDKISADIKGTALMRRENYDYNQFIAKSYWLWDSNINYKLDNSRTVFLTVNNIFDAYYDGVAGYPNGGRSFLLGVRAVI
ncbi:TonB-dependent receptor plug domain-containing protein [Dendrosporobacter sp. 1207_IL3150]|uniref:TonB-dependent receptor plug domain-containing protein n=1 Tax=Dendrosporobacter sp. 1207_IL3150 TaxID=3084054 RepID=UPI002FDAE4AD